MARRPRDTQQEHQDRIRRAQARGFSSADEERRYRAQARAANPAVADDRDFTLVMAQASKIGPGYFTRDELAAIWQSYGYDINWDDSDDPFYAWLDDISGDPNA